jgi:TPP-dependent pyruvate/acetoin dehydrogenase alpha subunit
LTDLAAAYKIPTKQIDGADSGAVHATVSEAVEKIRRGDGPQFIEAQTVRWPGSETNWPSIAQPTDASLAWDVTAVPEKVREWYRSSDPLLMFIRELVQAGHATREEIAGIEKTVKAEIAEAVKFALASPYPNAEEAVKEIFA